MPTTGTPMGLLRMHEVYVNYDGPRLFACINEAGTYYFGVFADEDDVSETYLYAPASEFRFWAVRSGQLSLRQAFANPTDGGLFVARTSLDVAEESVSWLAASDVPDEWLPGVDARLDLPTPTVLPLSEAELERDSVALTRTLAAFELDTPFMTTEFPLRALGDIMRLVQESVDSFGQVVQDQRTNRGAVQQDILEETELTYFATRAASFAFVVAATPKAQLFEAPLLSQSIAVLLHVMEAGASEERLREALEPLHPRALAKYRDLLEILEDVRSGLTAVLATPTGDTQRSYLDRDGVATSLALVRTSMQQETERETVEAILVGVNVRTFSFELLDDSTGNKYSGRAIQPARDRLVGLTTGHRYIATLLREAEVQPVTGEVHYKYRLEAISEP